MESAPATRSHTPSSIHSQHDIKPPQFNTEHFLSMSNSTTNAGDKREHSTPVAAHTNNGFNGLLRGAEREQRDLPNHHLARYTIFFREILCFRRGTNIFHLFKRGSYLILFKFLNSFIIKTMKKTKKKTVIVVKK